MKVIFVINTFLFRMRVKANWNLPHLPRIGERISPHVIMFQEEFTYHNVLKYLTDEAKNDFNKFNDPVIGKLIADAMRKVSKDGVITTYLLGRIRGSSMD